MVLAQYVNEEQQRQQRSHTHASRNVAYVIEAHFELTGKAGPDDSAEKHYNIFLRRCAMDSASTALT